MSPQSIETAVSAIHATPHKIVYEFAGAGAQALAWLHAVGGSSKTILEATDRYAAASLIEAVGFEPAHFVSTQVAQAMATHAYLRACRLTGVSVDVAGVGCTAAIATDRTKRGEHRCCVAVCNMHGVVTYTLNLTKGRRSRQEEETLVSLLVLKAIAKTCGLPGLEPALTLQAGESAQETVDRINLLDRLIADQFPLIIVLSDGQLVPAKSLPNIVLLSGAFNPLHDGHRQLAEVVTRKLDQQVYFELPLVNAEKAPIGSAEAGRRIAQFYKFAPLLLTTAPLFSQKARLFPHSTFILGADTAVRLIQPRFYNNNPTEMLAALDDIRKAGCRFLVAGRFHNDHFLTLKELNLPAGYHELFEDISEVEFRLDISSTLLRQG
jgi:hypothetical protein